MRMRRAAGDFEARKNGREAVEATRELHAYKVAPKMPTTGQAGAAGPGGAPAKPKPSAPILAMGREAKQEIEKLAATTIVHIGDKTFYRKPDGTLYDSLYDEAKHKKKIVEVKAFSDAYFALLKKHAGIGRYLAKGEPMVLVVGEEVYKITKS